MNKLIDIRLKGSYFSIFPSIFDSTAQEAYMENTEAYEQLFLDADKYQAVMRALADRLYRELHDGK